MASRGHRFTLDPDADNFTFNIDEDDDAERVEDGASFVREIKERVPTGIPPPPKPKQTKTGFPQHRSRGNVSAFRLRQQQKAADDVNRNSSLPTRREPSDRAILNHISRKNGIDPDSKERAEISEENKKRIAQMSTEDIEEARSEIMSSFSPAFLERLLKRADIEEDQHDQDWEPKDKQDSTHNKNKSSVERDQKKVSFAAGFSGEGTASGIGFSDTMSTQQPPDNNSGIIEPQFHEVPPSIHFPTPPRNIDDYVALDPDSPSFLSDLKKHYFPTLPEDPSTLAWLKDPTEDESESSPYAPTQTRYAPSDIRFDFAGRLVAPNDSRDISVSKGLHHHGDAPESAGYTIPELSLLARSSLPNQRCIAYQVLGRIIYRLGRGDFGPRGTELQEGLWGCIEKERPLEVMMSEANRTGGHVSAKAYATEALWLWRRGGGGDRGLLKPGETIAK